MSRHSPAAHCPYCHNTIIVLCYKFSPASLPTTIQSCNTIQALQPLSHNTIQSCNTNSAFFSAIQTSVLQYTSSLSGSSLQYKILYCNTIPILLKYNWAVAHSKSTPDFFFFVFPYKYFFFIISSNLKNHKNQFFFSFSCTLK